MAAYYNEIEPFAAAWLRELIKRDLIAPGDVDERSIADVSGTDLRGYAQCHFFAGIGVWSYALRRAGWADDSPVWTGSCPCQPFSASGERSGFDDPRHLWPAWYRLIGECRPHVVFGEQVSSRDGLAWFDIVAAEMEEAGYAIGALNTDAAGVGAPHLRRRLYFVADTARVHVAGSAEPGDNPGSAPPGGAIRRAPAGRGSSTSTLADPDGGNASAEGLQSGGKHGFGTQNGLADSWRRVRWIECRDGKRRPVPIEPALFPLAARTPGRLDCVRGAGNALCAPQAVAFIEAYLDVCEGR